MVCGRSTRGLPDRITFAGNVGSESAVHVIEAGKADIAPTLLGLSKAQLARLFTRYPSQLRLSPSPSTDWFFLNTKVSPFDDVRVRRAVNYAFDRHAYKVLQGLGYASTCQVLPPDYPAYRRTCLYGSGGAAAVAKARRLVRSAGRTGVRVTVWMPSLGVPQGHFMVHLLNSIGLRAHLKVISVASGLDTYFQRISDPRTRAQAGYYGWISDYPSDAGFLPPVFSCDTGNASEFCSRGVDRLFAKAEAAQGRIQRPPRRSGSRPSAPSSSRLRSCRPTTRRTSRSLPRASATSSTTPSGACCWISSGSSSPQWRKWRRPVNTIAAPACSTAGDDLGVALEPPGWTIAVDARLERELRAVGEGEERVGGERGAVRSCAVLARLLDGDPHGVHAAHLAGADPDRRAAPSRARSRSTRRACRPARRRASSPQSASSARRRRRSMPSRSSTSQSRSWTSMPPSTRL